MDSVKLQAAEHGFKRDIFTDHVVIADTQMLNEWTAQERELDRMPAYRIYQAERFQGVRKEDIARCRNVALQLKRVKIRQAA